MVAEECMFLTSWRGCEEVVRLPVEFLFPELVAIRWSVGVQCGEKEANRMPLDALFPEWRFEESRLEGGEDLSVQELGSDAVLVTKALPYPSSLAGLDTPVAGGNCSRLSPIEVADLTSVDAAVGSLGLPRRRGRPKKTRDDVTVSALVVDPGEGNSRGCFSRPRGRPKKGVSSSMGLVPVRSSSPSSGEGVLDAAENQLVVFDPQRDKGPLGVMTRARAALAIGV